MSGIRQLLIGAGILLTGLCSNLRCEAQELSIRGVIATPNAFERPLWFSLNPLTRNSIEVGSMEEWALLNEEAKVELHARWARQASSTLDPVREHFGRHFSSPVKVSLRVGNSSVSNWSPFPDRALDARVIRYPMPRWAAYGRPGRK